MRLADQLQSGLARQSFPETSVVGEPHNDKYLKMGPPITRML